MTLLELREKISEWAYMRRVWLAVSPRVKTKTREAAHDRMLHIEQYILKRTQTDEPNHFPDATKKVSEGGQP